MGDTSRGWRHVARLQVRYIDKLSVVMTTSHSGFRRKLVRVNLGVILHIPRIQYLF